VWVLQPEQRVPDQHYSVLQSTLTLLMPQQRQTLSSERARTVPSGRRPFDLLVCPEAFLAWSELPGVLECLEDIHATGAVHMGLHGDSGHLITKPAARDMLQLLENNRVHERDLQSIREWLESQHSGDRFNFAALLQIDKEGHRRACIHPKVVRSSDETSGSADESMTEANILKLVTLQPEVSKFPKMNVQPLICADALAGGSAELPEGPIGALNGEVVSCADNHVDLVSVPTWTATIDSKNDASVQLWHQLFRESFERAAFRADRWRHHHAYFILANYGTGPHGTRAGASGIFCPAPLPKKGLPRWLCVHRYGRPNEPPKGDNQWQDPSLYDEDPGNWSVLAYMVTMRSRTSTQADAQERCRLLAFTICASLSSECSLTKTPSITDCETWSLQRNGTVWEECDDDD
jgi:hypothetical protein